MTAENQTSRITGILYLVVVATGMFSLAYVPSRLNVANDLQATIQNIIGSGTLYRLGIASFMVEQVAFLLLLLALYRLLRLVNRTMAVLMVALAATSVPISLNSLAHPLDVLSLLASVPSGDTVVPAHIQALVKGSLDAYRNGLLVASMFWGLWLFPFGYLVFRSGFLPRALGVLLMAGCFGYLVDVFGTLLVPRYVQLPVSDYATLPAAVGEIGTCAWLLLVGTDRRADPGIRRLSETARVPWREP